MRKTKDYLMENSIGDKREESKDSIIGKLVAVEGDAVVYPYCRNCNK